MKEGLPKNVVSTVTEWILLGSIILAPLVVIPIFANFLVTSKLLLLFLSAIVLIALFVWKTVRSQTIELPHSSLIVGLSVFGVSALVSSLLTTQYPAENLLGTGGMYVALAAIAIIGGQFLQARSDRKFMNVLNVGGVLLALSTVLQHFGYGIAYLLNQVLPLNIPNNDSFNISGNLWVATQVLVVVLVANVVMAVTRKKVTMMQAISFPLLLIGLAFCIFGILPGKPTAPALIPYTLSWSIGIDSLKTPKTALIGFGPENYADAFQLFKPTWINGTSWWNTIPGQGSDLPLSLLPTLGLIGLGAWLFLVVKIVSHLPRAVQRHGGVVGVIVATLIIQILFTPTLVMAWIQAIALAYLIANRENSKPMVIHLFKITYLDPEQHQDRKELATALSWGIPIGLSAAVIIALIWPIGQAYAASHYFFRALLAQQQNDLNGLYVNEQQAAQLNRYISSYRSNFALTSLTVARALAQQQDKAQDPTTQQQITALIQQSINEGRAATALRPLDSQSWYVLGQVYGSIVGTTPDALQWAIAAYTQAIQVNATSPLLRLELGTLLYSQKNYQDAALLFQQAYQLKPDLPNAAYSLANALRQLNQIQQAQAAYQAALNLLPPASEEYKTVKAEMDSLPKVPDQTQSGTGTQQSAAGSKTAPKQASSSAQTNPSATQSNVNRSPDSAVQQPAPETLPAQLSASPSPVPSPTAEPLP